MLKYNLSDIKHRILQLENPNYQEHKNYLTAIIDRSATEWTFPSWMEISTIGCSAFEAFRNLTSITVSDGVATIGINAFYNCVSLTSVTIPSSVMRIGWDAFAGCISLTDIIIPNSVTRIDEDAFYRCDSLTDMYLYPITPPTLASTSAISNYTTTIHVPIGYGNAYKNATNWSSFADKIVEDIEI